MSFVGEPFDHDIFITYSHGDARRDGEGMPKNWAAGFCSELESELDYELGDGNKKDGLVNIFRDEDYRSDRNLDRHGPPKEGLKSKIEKSAMLLVLMSPKYLSSTWCEHERTWWEEWAEELKISTSNRTILAQISPTKGKDWPGLLTDSDGNNFIGRNFINPLKPRPLEWPKPHLESRGEFRDELVDLAGEIREKLIDLKNEMESRRQAETDRQRLTDGNSQKTIYLHGRKEHEQAWNSVYERLEQNGFVMSAISTDRAHGNARRQEKAKKIRLEGLRISDALLLLGTDDPASLNNDLISVGRHDRFEARDQSNKPLPCAVFDTADIESRFSRVKRTADQLNIDWLSGTVEKPPDIHGWLSEAVSP